MQRDFVILVKKSRGLCFGPGSKAWTLSRVMEKEALKYNMDVRKETFDMDERFREGLKVSAASILTC